VGGMPKNSPVWVAVLRNSCQMVSFGYAFVLYYEFEMLHPSIAIHQDGIIHLCQEYGVARLEIFGSAVTDAFDPERSDVDFLVEFSDSFDYDRYFDFIDDLEKLLGRSVQLVTRKYLRNPYFIHAVETTKLPLYAA
jgi:hypothetical protein